MNQEKKDDFIFGLRPVLEALEAGKTIDKIFVQNALQGEIYIELKQLLSKHNIRPNYVPGGDRDRWPGRRDTLPDRCRRRRGCIGRDCNL